MELDPWPASEQKATKGLLCVFLALASLGLGWGLAELWSQPFYSLLSVFTVSSKMTFIKTSLNILLPVYFIIHVQQTEKEKMIKDPHRPVIRRDAAC